jgi:hypothetical protein
MEFRPNLVVQKQNLVLKEVAKKQTNLVPSFTTTLSAIPLNKKIMVAFIRMQLKPCSRKGHDGYTQEG